MAQNVSDEPEATIDSSKLVKKFAYSKKSSFWNLIYDLHNFILRHNGDCLEGKRNQFVHILSNTIYVIETNFYTAGGSKLNETARSYKMIAEEARQVRGVEFMWITDGGGWRSARRNLEETFNTMTHLYNIDDMENGVFLSLFR